MFHVQVFTSFAQLYLEPFYATWGRFNDMVERFSNHNLLNQSLILYFYNGLDEATRNWIDYGAWATGDHVLQRGHDDVIHLLNDMANFEYHWHWDHSL